MIALEEGMSTDSFSLLQIWHKGVNLNSSQQKVIFHRDSIMDFSPNKGFNFWLDVQIP